MDWPLLRKDHHEVVDYVITHLAEPLDAAARSAVALLSSGGRIFTCGNGGSAADAQHLAAELVGRFLLTRRAIASIALTTDTSILTAVANDFGYEQVFARQIEALARPGDMLVVFSTSGNSPNVVQAVQKAAGLGVETVAFLGGDGGQLAAMVTHPLIVACTRHTPRIQEAHLLMLHAFCEHIETALAATPTPESPL
jgi:D-sedoheptulose 7-phosphate isomerase